ncbi:MAG: helix-turn-helix domain-containing protein [Bacteroidetes bacterium]|nr:helix-turn-helix domain-containing protein [Bacteroidota bacterium]
METSIGYKRPSKKERMMAQSSFNVLQNTISKYGIEKVDIEIEGTNDKLVLPLSAVKLLTEILKNISEGRMISILPVAAELTTQKAAEILGCSRPFVIKLLEENRIPFTKIGKHRRIMVEDVMKYKAHLKAEQKQNLIEMMSDDEEAGLYDS